MKPIRDLRAYGDDLVKASSPAEGGRIAMRAMAQPSRSPWVRRAVIALTSLAVFSGANIGMALAANSSVPGDRLYGIDRAYERVGAALGFNINVAAERFEEATELSNRGRFSTAFSTASEGAHSLNNPGLSHALEVLDQLSVDTEGINSDDLPAGLQKEMNEQARELFGIGKTVSKVAMGYGNQAEEIAAFEHQSLSMAEYVGSAREARGLRPGLGHDGPPGLGGTLPPGQEKKPTP